MKNITKHLAGWVTLVGLLWQSPQGEQFVRWLVQAHPRATGAVSTISALLLLLHNPSVVKALGLQIEQTTTTTKAEVVPVSSTTPQP